MSNCKGRMETGHWLASLLSEAGVRRRSIISWNANIFRGRLAMNEERVQRRLAAILAADIAGYSRLMGDDDEGTLRDLKAHRVALIDPKITEHRGRIVKTTGD